MFSSPVVCEEHGYMRVITISSPGLNDNKVCKVLFDCVM